MISFRQLTSYIAATIAVTCATSPFGRAFTIISPQPSASPTRTALLAEPLTSRRSFLSTIATSSLATTATTFVPLKPSFAASNKDALISDLTASLEKISTIPPLLESAEWDKVRTILKTPPVNQLWNLGESQNTLVKLAKETGNFDLMEMKDELAISLQMTDQYSYDNVFIYYQPGNGKVKTKEPLEMANKAISQLKEALDVANSS